MRARDVIEEAVLASQRDRDRLRDQKRIAQYRRAVVARVHETALLGPSSVAAPARPPGFLRLLHLTITYLRDCRPRSLAEADLRRERGIDLDTPFLREELRRNPKVAYDPALGLYRYAPTLGADVRDRKALKAFVLSAPHRPFSYADLADAYDGAERDLVSLLAPSPGKLATLVRASPPICLGDSQGGVCFANPIRRRSHYGLPVDAEFQRMFLAVPVPEPRDVERFLGDLGMNVATFREDDASAAKRALPSCAARHAKRRRE